MRTKGTATALEARRLVAADLLLDGKSVAEVAEIVGASGSSVRRWRSAYRSGGAAALAAKPHLGPKPKLSLPRQHRLIEILTGGAEKAGYRTELWTGRRIAEVIQRHFGIAYHRGTVCRLLRSLHWSAEIKLLGRNDTTGNTEYGLKVTGQIKAFTATMEALKKINKWPGFSFKWGREVQKICNQTPPDFTGAGGFMSTGKKTLVFTQPAVERETQAQNLLINWTCLDQKGTAKFTP